MTAGYDFDAQKWFVQDCKGKDYAAKMIYGCDMTGFTLDCWHKVRVCAIDGELKLWCDGSLVLETKELEQITTGRVGVYTEKAVIYMDNIELKLLSGQGRVEKAVLDNYILIDDYYSEGGALFWHSDNLALFNYFSNLYLSEDQGKTFRRATEKECKKYAFFCQTDRTNYIELHNGYILKVDNYTGGKAYLSRDRGVSYEQVGKMWKEEELEKNWAFYGGMNNMLKEINLGDINGDGKSEYRVFYCADVRAYGNPEGVGKIDYHWEEIYFTDDYGHTWQKSKFDTRFISGLNHICESRIARCNDGTLRMYCTWNDSKAMRYFTSYDLGKTWGEERALPRIRCARSSHDLVTDPDTGYTYMAFVYCPNEGNGAALPRTRFSLIRTIDGKNWEYLMDLWRWDDTALGRTANINQIVDPSITITKDYIFVTAGWSESIADENCLLPFHNNQRQTMIKIDKSKLVPYEKWPEDYAEKADILHISVTAPEKTAYQVGEALDLQGGFLDVYYYDGSSERVSMEVPEVNVSEPDEKINYTAKFNVPDMEKAGEKLLRVTYKGFADNFTITVK